MRTLLLLPVLLALPACDKAEETPQPVAPAILPEPKPLSRRTPAPAEAESPPAPAPAASAEKPPAPPPPPTAEELLALQKEVEEVLALGAPFMEGGAVEDTQDLRGRVIELLKRRGKMLPGMTPEQRAEVAKQFAPVLQLRAKLIPPVDLLKNLKEARSRVPGAPQRPATPAASEAPPETEAPPPAPDNAPPQ